MSVVFSTMAKLAVSSIAAETLETGDLALGNPSSNKEVLSLSTKSLQSVSMRHCIHGIHRTLGALCCRVWNPSYNESSMATPNV